MHAILVDLLAGQELPAELCRAVPQFLQHHSLPATARHCAAVAAEARRLAQRFDIDPQAAETAGWLHDISAVIPHSQRLPAAEQLGLEILPEERRGPMLLHQKLSAVIAAELFAVHDPEILPAIACHTTLRPDPTPLDLALFVADKISWDQAGQPPYLPDLQQALNISLARAAWVYLDHLWQRRNELPAPFHPWAAAAYRQLGGF